MSYVYDTKPTGSFTYDTEPQISTAGNIYAGNLMGALCLTYPTDILSEGAYSYDSKPTSNYSFDTKPT